MERQESEASGDDTQAWSETNESCVILKRGGELPRCLRCVAVFIKFRVIKVNDEDLNHHLFCDAVFTDSIASKAENQQYKALSVALS